MIFFELTFDGYNSHCYTLKTHNPIPLVVTKITDAMVIG